MINPTNIKRVCLVQYKVDFRKGHNGLLAESFKLGLNPSSGDLVIFINSRKNAIKFLFADSNGLWLSCKKFRSGTVSSEFKFITDLKVKKVSRSMVAKLIEGNNFRVV